MHFGTIAALVFAKFVTLWGDRNLLAPTVSCGALLLAWWLRRAHNRIRVDCALRFHLISGVVTYIVEALGVRPCSS